MADDGNPSAGHGQRSLGQADDHFAFWLLRLADEMAARFARMARSQRITYTQWLVLRQLHEHAGATGCQLADQLGLSRGTVSRIVSALQKRGLVIRNSMAGDKRYLATQLTAEGNALVPVLSELAEQNELGFFGKLPTGLREVVRKILRETAIASTATFRQRRARIGKRTAAEWAKPNP